MAKATRTSILSDQKHLGREPEFKGEVLSGISLIKALNWYNYFGDSDIAKTYIQEYCNKNKIKIKISNHFLNTYAWLARIKMRGGNFDEVTTRKFESYIKLLQNGANIQALNKLTHTEPTTASAEQKPIQNRLDLWMPAIEDMVDNYKSSDSMYNFIRANNIPQMYVRQIQDYYRPILEEAVAAYNKTDKELQEAYRHFSRADFKSYITRLKSIVEDCDKFLDNVKRERKPRKKKTKSVEAILKHFKYLKFDSNLQISSEDPSKIIGASAVYVFNVKYRTITVFTAKDGEGLSVSRTSIINYDEEQSLTKRTGRKTSEIVKKIVDGTKRSRIRVITDLKAEPIKFVNRLNENCLILKIDK